MLRVIMEVIHRVIDRVLNPWLYSNAEVLEEVRIAKRDANAAKVAVTRLRSELRGEEHSPEVPRDTVRVSDGPPVRKPVDPVVSAPAGLKAGQSMTKYMQGR